MFCKQCGSQIPDDAVICVHCGVATGNSVALASPEAKSKIGYILLGLFLGLFGIHNFYAGYTGKAVAQLLLAVLLCWTIVVPIIVFIWCIVDICTVTRDAKGQPFV